MAAALPLYLLEQTEESIRQRMLDRLPSDLDKSEGSFIWDAVAPTAIELAMAAIWAQEVLRRGFASTTFGAYLDLRCEEHGVARRAAVKARGQVRFTGKAGTVIAAGTRVATPADRVTGTSSVEYETTHAVTLDGSGAVSADIAAVQAGAGGNVSAESLSIVVTPITGVTGVTNTDAVVGGIDTENDSSLLARYLQKVRSPSAGGNKADYVNWALEVPGVGGVSVVPVRDGPGTVSVAIINGSNEPADRNLVDAVQNYIAPPWTNRIEAETMTIGGFGVSLDTGSGDDSASGVKMEYSASGDGTVSHPLHTVLQQPGIWQARIRVKASSDVGSGDLLQAGIWNVAANDWASTTAAGATDAVRTLQADDLSLTFVDVVQPFNWNGQDQVELRLARLQTDTTTIIWVDNSDLVSAFSKDSGEGKAPIGARVTVEPATAVLVNITASLTITPGYNAASVKAAAEQNVVHYIKSLAFTDDNDVRHVRIGQAILDTVGVQDYSELLVNGGTGNVAVDIQEAAVIGVVSFS